MYTRRLQVTFWPTRLSQITILEFWLGPGFETCTFGCVENVLCDAVQKPALYKKLQPKV